jgi:protein TonB
MKPLRIGTVAVALLASTGVAAAQTQEVYKPGPGITPPVVIKDGAPRYTADAMDAKVQGVVELECVVGTNGEPRDIRVVRALDPGLDKEAIAAVERWRFKPGTKDGQAVPVQVTIEMAFTLRSPGAAQAPRASEPAPETIYETKTPGITPPRVVKRVHPAYTAEARAARIQGLVELECVVLSNGTIGDVRVVKTLDPGLDAEAIKAVRQWRFEPGAKDGQPVAVRVAIEMTFTLK